jgi:DNA-binding Xre family transcriptional regulator
MSMPMNVRIRRYYSVRHQSMIKLKVREIADARRINMAKLSRMADVNYNTIRAIYDNPNRDVAVTTLEKIAKALKVEVTDLYEIIPDDEP